jgi:hypothetical protein
MTYTIEYHQAALYLDALRQAREWWTLKAGPDAARLAHDKSHGKFLSEIADDARRYLYKIDSITIEIERMEAYIRDNKPRKKGKR